MDIQLRRRIQKDRTLGAKLKELRKSKGIQAKFVADALGVSAGFLSDLESGNRHWSDEREKAYRKAIGVSTGNTAGTNRLFGRNRP